MMDESVVIRAARREELGLLPELERAATQRFYELPEMRDVPEDVTDLEDFEKAHEAGLVWVAVTGEEVIGFAFAAPVDRRLHLEELAVLQAYGRRGIGRRLVDAVIDDARERGFGGVSLTTFRGVPWNEPYYARLGFRALEPGEHTPELRVAIDDEVRRGLTWDKRVAMALDF
jgi:predicted N-acetyltransferase YhbS